MKSDGLKRLLIQYLFNKKQLKLWALFVFVLTAYVVNIHFAVMLNEWNGRFYNALQQVDATSIYHELLYFLVLALLIIVVLITANYLKKRLILALRRDLTFIFIQRWLSPDSAHYLLRESDNEPDNPDQRITEDINGLVALTINLIVSFFDTVLTIGTFSIILWQISGPLTLLGVTIPGYMFWVCIIYTTIATIITHIIGHKLKWLNFEGQHKEANFRASLIEKRRHADAIAGAGGEILEKKLLHRQFLSLFDVLIRLVKKRRDLELFTVGLGHFTHMAPIFFALPSFLSGTIQLGGLMQIRSAFGNVARSFSWIIFAYNDLAKLAATYERLRQLEDGLKYADKQHQELKDQRLIIPCGMLADLTLNIPIDSIKYRKLNVQLNLQPGKLTILTGPSGIGKSTLLKTLSGFYNGFIGHIHATEKIFWIPQKVYIPLGTLRQNLAYPLHQDSLSNKDAQSLLSLMDLDRLMADIDTHRDWSTLLSGGEQQKIALIRAIHHSPDVLLLDEVTAGIDENMAKQMLSIIRYKLPYTAILLVTHQSSLFELADQLITLTQSKDTINA